MLVHLVRMFIIYGSYKSWVLSWSQNVTCILYTCFKHFNVGGKKKSHCIELSLVHVFLIAQQKTHSVNVTKLKSEMNYCLVHPKLMLHNNAVKKK